MDSGVFRLFDLADELIVNIIEQLDCDLPSLCNLARSCHRLQLLAEPLLYRRLFIRTKADVQKLRHATLSHMRRATYVHRVEARCQYLEYRDEKVCFPDLIQLLDETRNLKDLTVESPLCNRGTHRRGPDWNYAAFHNGLFGLHQWRMNETLDSLRKLELHLNGVNGKRYWKVNASSRWIFEHPALQEVTISCAKLSGSSMNDLCGIASTPLKTLKLIECNISQQALTGIMMCPSALRCLHLGENCHHQPYRANRKYNTLCTRNPTEFFSALAQQRESLEELTYSTPELDGMEGQSKIGRGLSGFSKLHSVSLEGARCPTFEEALWASSRSTEPLPLVTLRLSAVMDELGMPEWFDGEDGKAFVSWLQTIASDFPELKELCFTATPHPRLDMSEERKANISSLKATFERRRLVFSLHEKAMFTGYIPPYLDGESPPGDGLVYSTDGTGFKQPSHEIPWSLVGDGVGFGNDVLADFDFDSFLDDQDPTFDDFMDQTNYQPLAGPAGAGMSSAELGDEGASDVSL